jgi:prepilin-type processing-associated H-X9-DG protein
MEWHGRRDSHNVAFLDGHVRFLSIQKGYYLADTYTVLPFKDLYAMARDVSGDAPPHPYWDDGVVDVTDFLRYLSEFGTVNESAARDFGDPVWSTDGYIDMLDVLSNESMQSPD